MFELPPAEVFCCPCQDKLFDKQAREEHLQSVRQEMQDQIEQKSKTSDRRQRVRRQLKRELKDLDSWTPSAGPIDGTRKRVKKTNRL